MYLICLALTCSYSSYPCYIILISLGFTQIELSGYEKYLRIVDKMKRGEQKIGVIGTFNHVSYVDAVALMWLFTPTGVSRNENKDIPIVGKTMCFIMIHHKSNNLTMII